MSTLWRFHLQPEIRMFVVEAPAFTAGVWIDQRDEIVEVAPILRHKTGQTLSHLEEFVRWRGWGLKETTPDRIVEVQINTNEEAKARAELQRLRPDAVILKCLPRPTPFLGHRPPLTVVRRIHPERTEDTG